MGTHQIKALRAHYSPIENEALTLFFQDPKLSVDTVARQLSEKYRHKSITKGMISQIRFEVRQRLAAAQSPTPLPSVQAKPHLVRLSVSAETLGELFKTEKPMAEQQKLFPDSTVLAESQPPFQDSTTEERIKFLEDFALSHINASIDAARRALKEKFGRAVGTQAISDTLSLVKKLARESGAAPARPMAMPAILACVRTMQENGVRQITLDKHGGFTVRTNDDF